MRYSFSDNGYSQGIPSKLNKVKRAANIGSLACPLALWSEEASMQAILQTRCDLHLPWKILMKETLQSFTKISTKRKTYARINSTIGKIQKDSNKRK